MKLFITTEERKKLLKKGFRSSTFIQIDKILTAMNLDPNAPMNERMKFIVNSEIKKRIKICYQKGLENVVYIVGEVNEDVIFNIQSFFEGENMGINLILVDYQNQWEEHHSSFYTVLTC